MPATVHVVTQANRLAVSYRMEIGNEVRRARLHAGLSQAAVAAALGRSGATISRVERGLVSNVTVQFLVCHAAVVGLALRVNLYPAGAPIRDAGQLKVVKRLEAHVRSTWRWMIEMPIRPGDLRAFDAGAIKPGCRIGFDVWAGVRDIQAQSRASMRKREDSGVDRLILVFSDTHANRHALREAADVLTRAFPMSTRQVLRALREGRDPGADGIVII
jgi:transcriptional regulator with XRE-family HTH domain